MYVTNKTDKELVVDYGCVEVRFPVNTPIEITDHAARHIFGYGEKDKLPFMTSLGIVRTMNDIPEGLKTLEKFEITDDLPKKNHSLSPVVEQVPLPPKKGGGKVQHLNA